MISFIIATTGRPSLRAAIASIETWPGDEILVIGNVHEFDSVPIRYIPCPAGHDWGSTERNRATPLARGRYLAHLDDDDTYLPGHRALMADAIARTPDQPVLFRMRLPNGSVLWDQPILVCGHVGTPMMLIPNVPARLGQWGEGQDCGDFHFLATMKWPCEQIVWRTDVIAQIGQAHP